MRRILTLLLAASLLTAPLRATWSILVLDTRTGEFVIASATCVDNSDLLQWTPVVLPGIGVAVCQAASPTELKVLIHDRMLEGQSPERIQTRIENKYASVGAFQYAILDMQGRSLLFTGNTNGRWAGGVTGQVGDLIYAIQGNVLAGPAVVDEAERAFLTTSGDLGQRVMVAMEAAMAQGGDGRCSCSIRFPDSCGTPPPNFTQTATIGYFVVSRPGDTRGDCTQNGGCANGDTYLVLNEPFHQAPSTDPVILLRQQYDAWRLAQAGRPDAFHSLVVPETERVDFDENRLVDYWVELYDVDATGLSSGGATFTLAHQPDSSGQAALENVIDHQDGSYTLQVRSGTQPGRDHFAFIADDGQGTTQLWPGQNLLHVDLPPAPVNRGRVVGNWGAIDVRDAQTVQDGAAAWLVADAGAGTELWRVPRDLNDEFSAPVAVAIDTVLPGELDSLWIAEDELNGVVALIGADGIARLHEIERPDVASSFGEPNKLGPLDQGLGGRAPSLLPSRTTIYYETDEGGTRRVYRADRLDTDARWFPGRAVQELSGPGVEGAPELFPGGRTLAFEQLGLGSPTLRLATAAPDGSWEAQGAIAGAHQLTGATARLAGWSASQGRAWLLVSPTPGAPAELRAYELGDDQSFSVQPDAVSVAAGGTLQFALNAGPDFDQAAYQIVLGATGSGARFADGVLPLTNQPGLTPRFLSANLPGMNGTLVAGQANASLPIAPNTPFQASLIGQRFRFAFVAQAASGESWVSAARAVDLLP